MVFSSHIFLFYFLPLALTLYYLAPRRAKHIVLTLVSYLFYGWANPYFVVLMFSSTVIDYFCGLAIAERLGTGRNRNIERLTPGAGRSRAQRTALWISICTNLGLLGFFKYANFGMDNASALLGALGLEEYQWKNFLRITLPLGISFYTFQSMSYSIDVYRGHAKAIRNFTDFSCYVAMFPQLVAGPIVRFHEVADQLESRSHTSEKFARGVAFMSCGLAKKIFLANACGKVADVCFEASSLNVVDAWFGVFAYSFQIYFDFSAYSDMAIGLGLMLGFMFPKNFDSPYLSESITEFWQRWHQSLSNWLRDYLYIPLGGNRKGDGRTYVNLAMVMFLGGLWHGASWNFICWGGVHGTMLAFERTQGKNAIYWRLPRSARVGITFLITSLAWVFFRSPNMGSAMGYFGSLIGLGPAYDGGALVSGLIYQPFYVLSFALAAIIVWNVRQTWDFTRTLNWPKAAWCSFLLIASIAVMTAQTFNPFIYFIF